MVVLIAGGTHTGKTMLAQRLLERYKYPYLSIDHLKMGLIRSGCCSLSPESNDEDLTAYLWPIIREIIKTNIENNQNLIIEGCYIPFGYREDFNREYLKNIKYICLIFSQNYIKEHFENILTHENVIEKRLHDDKYCTKDLMFLQNANNLKACMRYNCEYILIDNTYGVDFCL